MAHAFNNNKNKSLEYFTIDSNIFDNVKMQHLSARFGLKGEAILVRLLCEVYKNGYFLNFDDDSIVLFARSAGVNSIDFVKDVINECFKRGFFDKAIFDLFGILTSKGIQQRFVEATQRRTNVNFIEEYLLIDLTEKYKKTVNVNINSKNVNINSKNVNINLQSKSKSKSKKEEEGKIPPHKNFLGNIGNRKTLPELLEIAIANYPKENTQRLTAIANKYYSLRNKDGGFCLGNGKPIKDIPADFLQWLASDLSKKTFVVPAERERENLTSRGWL
jgi:hypothetical protein